ncbi:MAG: ABC transporter substrate-binding protein [Actinomycetota bacterium]|nr:ABC transporter substrate-binding protein [Actinomycetota bacterium]
MAVLALLGSACGGNGGGGDGGAGSQEAVPAEKQELVVGTNDDPWVESSPSDKKRIPNYPLNADVCETLVQLSPKYDVLPVIASQWEHVGGNTFRFTLNDRVKFSDGRPVTAEDVKYSLDYTVKQPETSGFAFLGAESMKVIDQRTIEVTPTKPNLRLVEQINHPTYAILAPGSDPFTDVKTTNCTGPFKVSEYVPGERLVVVRNDAYWGEPAKLDKITFRFFPDDTTRTLALQNGEVDLVTDVPRPVVGTLEKAPGIKLAKSTVGAVLMMYTALRDASGAPRVLSDVRLRQAVAHAMDKDEFVNGVLGGNAEVVDTVAPPTVLGPNAGVVKGLDHDPKAAGRLLDEAGWKAGADGVRTKDGRPLELSIVFDQTRTESSVVEFIQARLKDVGIVGKIERLDPGAYRNALDTGSYDLDLSLPNQNDANPAFLMSLRWYSKATGKNAKIISPGPNTEFDRLIDQTQQATDKAELQRLAAEAMHQLVDVEAAGIPLAGIYRVLGLRDRVHGLEVHPSGTNQRWNDVFIAKE